MYKFEKGMVVDFQAEIDAMVQHIEQRWDVVPGLRDLFEFLCRKAALDAKFWFDDARVSSILNSKASARTGHLADLLPQETMEIVPFHDHCIVLCREAASACSTLAEASLLLDDWDLTYVTDDLYQLALERYPGFSRIKPKGWYEGLERYSEVAGPERVDCADAAMFQGLDTESPGATRFSFQTSLPNVLHQERVYHRRAAKVLMSSAYVHFLHIVKFQNTDEMLREIELLDFREREPTPIFNLKLQPEHLVLATLFQVAAKPKKGVSRLGTKANFLSKLESRDPGGEPPLAGFEMAECCLRKLKRSVKQLQGLVVKI